MPFEISSWVYPTASRADYLAIVKSEDLEANAEEHDTLGFNAMRMILPVVGRTANWMLQLRVSAPTPRKTAIPMSPSSWYSRTERVIAGATVIESPVCTP